jgi:hypothetical protein
LPGRQEGIQKTGIEFEYLPSYRLTCRSSQIDFAAWKGGNTNWVRLKYCWHLQQAGPCVPGLLLFGKAGPWDSFGGWAKKNFIVNLLSSLLFQKISITLE